MRASKSSRRRARSRFSIASQESCAAARRSSGSRSRRRAFKSVCPVSSRLAAKAATEACSSRETSLSSIFTSNSAPSISMSRALQGCAEIQRRTSRSPSARSVRLPMGCVAARGWTPGPGAGSAAPDFEERADFAERVRSAQKSERGIPSRVEILLATASRSRWSPISRTFSAMARASLTLPRGVAKSGVAASASIWKSK